MLEPLDCDSIIRERQRADADAYFQRLWLYFRYRPWMPDEHASSEAPAISPNEASACTPATDEP